MKPELGAWIDCSEILHSIVDKHPVVVISVHLGNDGKWTQIYSKQALGWIKVGLLSYSPPQRRHNE